MAMEAFLSGVDWDEELNQRDVKETWNVFSTKCNEAIEQFMWVIKPRKKKKAPYMTSETKHFINKHERLYNIYNIYRRTGRIIDHDNHKKPVSAMIRRNKLLDSQKKITSFVTNKKEFSRYVTSKQQVKPKIQQLKKDDGRQTDNDKQAANELSEFFKSVFVTETTGDVPEIMEMEEDVMNQPIATLYHLEISVDDVHKRLKAIKADKSTGPDAINPAFLKVLAECLAAPMTMICKKFLQEQRLESR